MNATSVGSASRDVAKAVIITACDAWNLGFAESVGWHIQNAKSSQDGTTRPREERSQAIVLREIFGNPFRPVTCNPAWRTSAAMLLAAGIYTDRAFDRMPILADALQDAGCDSDDILNHLRDPQAAHVRGCWALDLVLGNE